MSDAEDELDEIREQKREELADRADSAESGDGPGTPTEPVHVDGEAHLSDLLNDHGVVLIDFYADWCGPCKTLEPVVADLAAETRATVAKVDVDDHQGLAGEYGVQSVPTMYLFSDGDPVERLVGVQDKGTLSGLIEQHA